MIALDVKADIKDAERYLMRISPKAVKPIASRSINKAASAALTVSKRQVSRAISLPQKEFKDRLFVRKANAQTLLAIVGVTKKGKEPFNLIRWVSPGKRQVGAFRKSRQGVRYKSPGGNTRKSLGDRSFIGQPKGKPLVFVRKEKARLPIVAKTGLSVKQGFVDPISEKMIRRRIREVFPKEFDRLIQRKIDRLG